MSPYATHLVPLIIWLLLPCVAMAPLNAHAALSDFSMQLQSIATNNGFADEDARLSKFLDVLYDYNMTEFPELATREGYAGQNGKWKR